MHVQFQILEDEEQGLFKAFLVGPKLSDADEEGFYLGSLSRKLAKEMPGLVRDWEEFMARVVERLLKRLEGDVPGLTFGPREREGAE